MLKQEIASSEEQLSTSASCMQELNERIDKKDERLLNLNSAIQRLEVELAKPCDMCINYENKLNKCYAQIQDLTTKLVPHSQHTLFRKYLTLIQFLIDLKVKVKTELQI